MRRKIKLDAQRIYERSMLAYEVRRDLEEGQFGAIPPYWCEECDERARKWNAKHPGSSDTGYVWCDERDIPSKTVFGRWTFYGPEEDETTCFCPVCGCADSIYEVKPQEYNLDFKARKRYKIHLNPTPHPGHCQHGIDWRENCETCWAIAHGGNK